MACRLSYVFNRHAFDLRNLLGDKWDIGRIIGFAAMRCRRQIRAVGLDQDAIHRHKLGDVSQILGIFEGQYA